MYKPMAKSMAMDKCRPPHLLNRLTDFDEIRILELLLLVHDAYSGMRLPESESRLRLDLLSGSRMPLWTS